MRPVIYSFSSCFPTRREIIKSSVLQVIESKDSYVKLLYGLVTATLVCKQQGERRPLNDEFALQGRREVEKKRGKKEKKNLAGPLLGRLAKPDTEAKLKSCCLLSGWMAPTGTYRGATCCMQLYYIRLRWTSVQCK